MAQYLYNRNCNVQQSEYMRRQIQRDNIARKQKKELKKISSWLGGAIILYLVLQVVVSLAMSKITINSGQTLYDIYKSCASFSYAVNILFISILSVAAPFG